MPKHLIAIIIKAEEVKYYRVIDIESSANRIHSINSRRIEKYLFTDYTFDECYELAIKSDIGGIKVRSDRKHALRTDPAIPKIVHGQSPIPNKSPLMKCSDKIFVNYEGRKITYGERDTHCVVVDVRTAHQKLSANGLKGARAKHGKVDIAGAKRMLTRNNSRRG